MNKSSLVLLTICLLGGALATQGSTGPLECLAETKITLDHAKQFVADVKAATMSEEDLFEEGINVYNEFYVISRDCGFSSESLTPIEKNETTKACFQSVKSFLPTFSALVNALYDMNFSEILTNGFLAYNEINNVESICNAANTDSTTTPTLSSSNILECATAGYKFYNEIEQFQADKDTAPLNVVVVEAYDIVEGLQPLINTCGININLHIPQINFPDLSSCVVDVQSLVDVIGNIRDHFKEKKYLQLIQDVQDAVINFNFISDECKPVANTFLAASPFTKNVLQCLKLTNLLKKNIDSIKTEYAEKDIPDLVVTGYNVIEGLQNLLNACQDTPIDLHIPQISFVNLHDCVSNAEDVISDLQAIKKDIAEKNWINLYTTAQQAVATYAVVKLDCSKASA